MGWKAVKDHYSIKHIVHIVNGNLCIGSRFISQIFVISPSGQFIEGGKGSERNEDLARYRAEIQADPAKFAELFAQQDTFSQSLPVFVVQDNAVVELQYEDFGFPNVTHCGLLMYANKCFKTRKEALEYAASDCERYINHLGRRIESLHKELTENTALLAAKEVALAEIKKELSE